MELLQKSTENVKGANAITGTAWKELIEAIKPGNIKGSEVAKNNARNRIKHHPAIITTLEMSNWEFFG